jgi:glyoxylase-like metal-dependent hydrolase (beta-lactamase superfamily II)
VSGKGRIDKLVTSGTFSLDGQDFDVDNNVWLVGDDSEVFVVDAAHEPAKIRAVIGTRRLLGVISTHGHNDHINAAVEVADAVGAPIALHPDDLMLWDNVHPGRAPDVLIEDGARFDVAGATLVALHTPGHSPGGVSLHDAEHHAVYGGDTLFKGGPGATGRSFSDFPTIIESIRTRLLTLPADTVVYTGHGDTTTIGDEAPDLDAWIARGH